MTDMTSGVIFAGIRTGVIDLYVEYTGTIYASYLTLSHTDDPKEVHEISERELSSRYNLLMLDPLGFNNTFCLAVRTDIATQFNLRTFSDLATVSSELIIGGSTEFLTRFDGLPNLKKLYDMSFKDEVVLSGTERYTAIAANEIQVTDAFSTDGLLLEHDLVVLEDDKSFFPPYEGVIIIRQDAAEEHPELLDVLEKLAGRLSDDVMRDLNYRVDVLGESPSDVAEWFLRENGFIR
jgi:osmoprotectant transport system substrate-binding protein